MHIKQKIDTQEEILLTKDVGAYGGHAFSSDGTELVFIEDIPKNVCLIGVSILFELGRRFWANLEMPFLSKWQKAVKKTDVTLSLLSLLMSTLFKESISKSNFIGILLAIISIYLISSSVWLVIRPSLQATNLKS